MKHSEKELLFDFDHLPRDEQDGYLQRISIIGEITDVVEFKCNDIFLKY
jgi:hypothetical protein